MFELSPMQFRVFGAFNGLDTPKLQIGNNGKQNLILSTGRRAGKTTLAAWIAADAIAKALHRRHRPHVEVFTPHKRFFLDVLDQIIKEEFMDLPQQVNKYVLVNQEKPTGGLLIYDDIFPEDRNLWCPWAKIFATGVNFPMHPNAGYVQMKPEELLGD